MTDPSTIARRAAESRYRTVTGVVTPIWKAKREGHEAAYLDLLPLIEESRRWMEDAEHHFECEAFNSVRTGDGTGPLLKCTCGRDAHLSKLSALMEPPTNDL